MIMMMMSDDEMCEITKTDNNNKKSLSQTNSLYKMLDIVNG